jgi:hypothetical protein
MTGIDAGEPGAEMRAFRRRVLDLVESLLEEQYESPEVRNLVYGRLFRANDLFPKRDSRPKTTTAFVADRIHRAHDGDDRRRALLVQFALVVAEYADVVDDVVDDDVAPGREAEALLVSQLLVPAMVRSASRLGDRAVDYWTADAAALVQVPLVREPEATPSPDAYLELLDEQASLRSSITGLAAVAAGADDDAVERAERVGRAVHRLMQFSTDLYQYGHDADDDPWNAVGLLSEEAFLDAIDRFRADLATAATYPDPYARQITAIWDRDFRSRYREAVEDAS